MWTETKVARLAAEERVNALRRKNPALWKRMEATRIVQDAVRLANERYWLLYTQLQRELNIGLIGPASDAHKTNLDVWLAAETKHRYLRELYDESPIMEEHK